MNFFNKFLESSAVNIILCYFFSYLIVNVQFYWHKKYYIFKCFIYLSANEKEAIQLDISLANMEKKLDSSNKYYIGTPLYDKTMDNGNKWNIIVENESQKIYGTGWNIISKGTEINNYGKTQYSWIVNYTTQELKQIDENYTELSYKSGLAVTDGLIFNADSLNMSDANSWF